MTNPKKITINSYDKTADDYTRYFFDDTKDEKPYLDKFFSDLPKTAKVLDAGCGPGTFSKLIVEKGLDCYGMDLSEKMIQIAKEKVSDGHFDVMDLADLKYEKGLFQAIIAMYSIIHISSEELPAVLKNFYNILDECGKLFIAAQSGSVEEVRSFGSTGEVFVHFYEIGSLRELLYKANFEVISQEIVEWFDQDEQEKYKIIYITAKKVKLF